MRGFYFIIICSALFSATGCDYRVVKDPNALDANNGTQSKPIAESSIIDAQLVKNSVLPQCMSCHVGRTPPELGSVSAIQQNISGILSDVNSNAMPPQKYGYAPLSECSKAILNKWSQLGMPATTTVTVGSLPECQGKVVDPPDNNLPIGQMPLTYKTLVTKILQPKCIKCHNPDYDDIEAAGILFYPYSEIISRPHLWSSPGGSSKIIRVLTKDNEERMPPPEDGAPLTQEEIQFVIRWLDAGAPE